MSGETGEEELRNGGAAEVLTNRAEKESARIRLTCMSARAFGCAAP